jgi:hypothetical protein
VSSTASSKSFFEPIAMAGCGSSRSTRCWLTLEHSFVGWRRCADANGLSTPSGGAVEVIEPH